MWFSDQINCLISLKGYQQEYSKRNVETQKPLVPLTLFPASQTSYFLRVWWRNLFRKRFFVSYLRYLPSQAVKSFTSHWLKKRIHRKISECTPSFQLDPDNLQGHLFLLISASLVFSIHLSSALYIVKKIFMQEANITLIMWTASACRLQELSDHICWIPGKKHPTPLGCCLLSPFGHW